MKRTKASYKGAIALEQKPQPRRRGLGRKNPIRIAQERALGILPPRPSPDGRIVVSKRAYKEVAAVGGINSDWAVNALSEDSDVWQNVFLLRQRSRDLFRTDAHFAKYREELWANTCGSNGINLRMDIKEAEDRPIKSMRERSFRKIYNRRRERVCKHLERKHGRKFEFRALSDDMAQAGDRDVYSNYIIEEGWKEWQRREFCTLAGRLSYKEVRYARLLSAARDGDFFLRHIKDPGVNKFGYSLHLINSEWCDFYLNTGLRDGNEIRMGIERDKYGKNLNYYFIRRQPMDWQYAIPGAFNYSAPDGHEVVEADEIIHYARYVDADSTRPAPWSAPIIVKARHLDKYEEAEVASSRLAACKMGMFWSDVVPEGGMRVGEDPDPTQANMLDAEPGGFQGLPWGVKFQEWNPTHPNQNFPAFRKEMLRSWCAGMPGANYNIIANDLEGISYSSGRLGMLDERELWKTIQQFDIDVAERPIFESWLEMALMTGALPLDFADYDRLNRPLFRGRRWAWVDPFKEVQASAMQVANKFTSRTRIIEDSDVDADFEQILFELAEEEMLMEELGMDSTPVVGKVSPAKPAEDTADDETDSTDDSQSNSQKSVRKVKEEILEARIIEPPKEEMTTKQLIETLMAFRATEPHRSEPQSITVSPNIAVPSPVVSIDKLQLPKQDAPIVNFKPEIKMPEVRSPDVVVNVAPPPAPEVKIHNEVKVPALKGIKVKRGRDGKMESVEFEKE